MREVSPSSLDCPCYGMVSVVPEYLGYPNAESGNDERLKDDLVRFLNMFIVIWDMEKDGEEIFWLHTM
jgi:hypothetical protein